MCYFIDCSGGAVKDVIFVIDTSSSIGFSRFQLVREMAENITSSIAVNSPESLFGLITFDDFALLQFNIFRHTELSTLLPAINPGIPYRSGFRTNTGNALSFLLSGGREGGFLRLRNETSNVAIVITDGSSSSSSSLRSSALSLHAANIFDVYAVGIGSNSFSELQLIASDPSFVFSTGFLSSFTAEQLVDDVLEQLCTSKCFNIEFMHMLKHNSELRMQKINNVIPMSLHICKYNYPILPVWIVPVFECYVY